MIRVERATPADFESVLPLLERFNNPAIKREQWRTLFFPPWSCDDDLRGFVLRDVEKTTGFFGVIPSEREVAGHRERFANLTSWVTLPEHRNHALRLFQAVATIEGRTLTCMTPLTATYPFYRRFGFQDLESQIRILLPVPSPRGFAASATSDPRRIERALSGPAREVFEHHRGANCRHLLIHDGARNCHVVFTRKKGRRFYFAHVHGISDREMFIEKIECVRIRLALAARTPFVMIESRWLGGVVPPWSRAANVGQVPVFKSATLRAEQIDNLYSEMVLLPL